MEKLSQRDAMRRIFASAPAGLSPDVLAAYCASLYGASEHLGEVERVSNAYSIKPIAYGRRLFADGVAKGWLSR